MDRHLLPSRAPAPEQAVGPARASSTEGLAPVPRAIAQSPRQLAQGQRLEAMLTSPRQTLQLQRVQTMVSNRPPPFEAAAFDHGGWERAVAPDSESAIASGDAGGDIVQAVWEPATQGRYVWVPTLAGRRWFYDVASDTYGYEVVDASALPLDDLRDYFDDVESDEQLIEAIRKQGQKPIRFGSYWASDDRVLEKFDARIVAQPIVDQVERLCVAYLLGLDDDGLDKALAEEFGVTNVELNVIAGIQLSRAFSAQCRVAGYEKGQDMLTHDSGFYCRHENEFKASVRPPRTTLRHVLRLSVWAAMGKEIEGRQEADQLASPGGVLDPKPVRAVGGLLAQFTHRVEPTRREGCLDILRKLHAVLIELTPEDLCVVMLHDLPGHFRAALRAKDEGIGARHNGKVAESLADRMAAPHLLTKQALMPYCTACVLRWRAFLKGEVLVVFDAASLTNVYGKTPNVQDATPQNLMADPMKGLPAKPWALINIDSADNLVTLAHELAHVIGFNPTGVEDSGHFTTSSNYESMELDQLPKLLFDAYFFEVLFSRLSKL